MICTSTERDDPFAEVIQSSAIDGSDEILNLDGLEAGDYILEVHNFVGDPADYFLSFRVLYNLFADDLDRFEENELYLRQDLLT